MKSLKLTFIAVFLFESHFFCQIIEIKEQTWFSLQTNIQLSNKYTINFDLGSRFCDKFLNLNRQNLARLVVEKRINTIHLGIGFAGFDTYSFKEKQMLFESRPFLQLRYINKLSEKMTLAFRYRNESRIYHFNKEILNRNRLQFLLERFYFKSLFTRINYEFFFSIPNKNSIEQRFSIGEGIRLKNLDVFTFYIYQLQNKITLENRIIGQHILGLQLTLNIKKGNN